MAQHPDPPPSWHHVDDGDVAGPVGHRELVGRILEGRIGPDTLVWRPGLEGWSRAGETPHLEALFRGGADAGAGASTAEEPPPLPGSAGGERAAEAETATPGTEAPGDDGGGPPRASWRSALPGWVEEHLWAAAAVTGLAGGAAVAALVLVLGGGGEAREAAGGAGTSVPALGAARDSVVRGHLERLRSGLDGVEGQQAAALRSRPGDLPYQRRVAFRGLRRVTDAALVRFVGLWGEVLAAAPADECGALSTWSASVPVTWRAVGRLAPSRMDTLLRVLDRATVREVRGTGEVTTAPPDSVADRSFQRLQEGLGPGQRDTLASYLQMEVQRPPQACWVDRLLFRGVAGLEPPHDRWLARAVVTPPGER